MTSKNPKPKQIVGLMADSHGRPHYIAKAISFFKEHDCSVVYHLGDICDSAHPETADHCVKLLRENHINGIKGNNDHLVVVNHEGRHHAHLTSATIEYLKNLPLISEQDDSLMTHSLPFVKERGLSSMVGVLGHSEAALFFKTHPHKTLFRGHSHHPEILWQQNHSLGVHKMSGGESIQIKDMQPLIITCGALDQGFIMIWDRGTQTIACHMMT
jgi:predicted phosphodiesterase